MLKAASLVTLGRALNEPRLEEDGAGRIDRWIAFTAVNGVTEYNSPCYNAVDIYALEWIHHYATDDKLRRKVAQCLDYLYADVFQHWHWEAGIGAGTHSRAYDRDRDTGLSLVSCLVFKQCGQPLRQPLRSFLYVFAVNDYPVPARIRAAARKEGMYPLWMRYTIGRPATAVDCSVYMTPRFSLATQTGRRPVYNDRPLWDIPLKITYAGSKVERRASYIAPQADDRARPGGRPAARRRAIVLYEVDLKGSGLDTGRMRLDIEPSEGGMCDEIIVAGKSYDRSTLSLEPAAVVGWRVADTLVAVRLLQSRGRDPERADERGPVSYRLGPVPDVGLCLDCPLAQPPGPVAVNDLNCGFLVACSTTREHSSLTEFLETFAGWTVRETLDKGIREIDWQAGNERLQLGWREANGLVTVTPRRRPPSGCQVAYRSRR